jgi:hypothetical protein
MVFCSSSRISLCGALCFLLESLATIAWLGKMTTDFNDYFREWLRAMCIAFLLFTQERLRYS